MKNNILFILILLLSGVAHSQETGHYLKFDLGAGQHRINYAPENGTVKPGFGFTGNLTYNYFFAPNWGFGTGIAVQTFKSTATLNFMSTTPSVDTDGDSFDYRANFNNWQESQKMLMLEIPIALNYRQQFGDNLGILISGGTKISLPVRSVYETVGGEITTTGYYPQWNVELSGMPQHGFDTYSEFPSSDIDAKLNFSLFANLGALYKISEKMDLYIGAYVNYGLSDVFNAVDREVYQVNEGIYNGTLASNQISKANLVSVGVKVGINLRLFSKNNDHAVMPVQLEIPYSEQLPVEPVKIEIIPDKEEVESIATDTISEEPTETVTIVVVEEEIDWRLIASQKASQIGHHFNKNNSSLDDNSDTSLSELSEIIKNNPDINLLIIGHTCDLGSEEINQRLGLRRAESLKEKLIEQGIPASRITTESRYYLEPLVPNTSEENRAKNRRVEVKIVE